MKSKFAVRIVSTSLSTELFAGVEFVEISGGASDLEFKIEAFGWQAVKKVKSKKAKGKSKRRFGNSRPCLTVLFSRLFFLFIILTSFLYFTFYFLPFSF